MAKPLIGLIVPPRGSFLPPDASRLYGERADFVVEGLGIDEMAVADFDAAAGRIATAARTLGERGVDAIAMLGTSLSFYRGLAFNRKLEEAMRSASGRPAVTATSAEVDALGSARSIAVGAAYDEAMSARLIAYFEAAGFSVAGIAALHIRKVREAMAATDDAITDLAEKACAKAGKADALFLSCGAFATGHLLAPLAARFSLPVVSSTPAALAAAFKAAAPASSSRNA